MQMSRRGFAGGLAMVLAGCGAGTAPSRRPAQAAYRTVPNPGFDTYVAGLRRKAAAQGISAATLDAAFRGVGFLPVVIERDRNQSEFKRALVDYLALVAPEEKIAPGRRAYAGQRRVLAEIDSRYGVPPEILAAIWGVESYFGTRRGDFPVLSATATLAYEGRRRAFFEAQVLACLRLLQNGDARPAQLVGSWAGAMGHTQFIPTTFEQYAVDFRGDGRREIWSDDPTDSFASTANYLARMGWRRGQIWGLEVRLPQTAPQSGTRSAAAWRAAGLRAAAGGTIPDHGSARLLTPAGAAGPAFLVYRNFDVILRYNASENYGLGVGYLAGRLAGGGPLVTAFPPDRYGLTLDDRRALQRGLTRRGFDAGTPDGVLGNKTEAALRAYQAANGLPVTGQPSRGLLDRLR